MNIKVAWIPITANELIQTCCDTSAQIGKATMNVAYKEIQMNIVLQNSKSCNIRLLWTCMISAVFVLCFSSCKQTNNIPTESQQALLAPQAKETTAEPSQSEATKIDPNVPTDNLPKMVEPKENDQNIQNINDQQKTESKCNCPCAEKTESNSDENSNANDEEKECDDEEDNESFGEHIDRLTAFSKRNEIQGDLGETKWNDLMPSLTTSELKVSPEEDVIKKLESKYKEKCAIQGSKTASDGSLVELIFCSTSDETENHVDKATDNKNESKNSDGIRRCTGDYEYCEYKCVDSVYLSLQSPKDHQKRIYEIETNFDLSFGECVDMFSDKTIQLSGVELRTLIDTTGLYVRTKWTSKQGHEHPEVGLSDETYTYKTHLFAGDNHRLVTSWDDSSYNIRSSYEKVDGSIKHEYSEDYTETYMYFKSGEFKQETSSANDESSLIKLLIERP